MRTSVFLALCCATLAFGFLPSPEQYEAKWFLPGIKNPDPSFADSTHTYDVRHYRLDLDLPMDTGAMTAHAGIWVASEVTQLDTVQFNFTKLVCDSVKRNGVAQGFSTSYIYLFVRLNPTLAQGDSALLDIYYHRVPTNPNMGYLWFRRGGSNTLHNICYSMSEPEDARYWMPCWDEPWDKAEHGCQFNITVPDSYKACANGSLDSVTSRSGKKTFWWTHPYPISTYLMNFNASVFADWRHWFHYAPGESMEVRYYVWPEDSANGVSAFENVVDMVEFFSDSTRFGLYPFIRNKYGMVAAYPFDWGGMEHQTMTTIHRWWVLYGSESGIAHELSHMWYGDKVTCHIWPEIWLNEGAATYLDPLWMYHFYGRQQFLDDMDSRRAAYFSTDSTTRFPLYNPGMARLFDWGHIYCKGSLVNHMLRYVEADTVFEEPGTWFRAERAYLDSFAYGTATTEDRKRVHERFTGLDLGWFFDEWIYQAGYPKYALNWFGRQVGDSWEVVFDVAQNNGAQAPDCFHMPVEFEVRTTAGPTLIHFPVTSNPQRTVIKIAGQPQGVTFDPNRWLLEQHTLTSGIENQIDPEFGVPGPTLHAIVPNPARGPARVSFSLPNARDASLRVYDAAGRLVSVLWSGKAAAGRHTVKLDGALPAGTYLVRLEVGGETRTRKLVVR